MTTINHLGPYDISDVNDDILGDIVYNKNLPVIIKQKVGDGDVFAVLAKDKGLKIACVGCFRRDMRITDVTRCKKCSSFTKHWDTKNGLRVMQCKETTIDAVAANCQQVAMDFQPGQVSDKNKFESVTDAELVRELEQRDLLKHIIEQATDEQLMGVMAARSIWTVYNARPTKLIHELRRQGEGVSIEDYYHNDKKKGEPHSSDEVGADVYAKSGKTTRQNKKKPIVKQFMPRSVTDYR